MKKYFLFLLLFLSVTLFCTVSLFAETNPDGSYSYSIPINVPAGINGMQPNLALEYNSSNGNGMLGVGWQLSGIGKISRDRTYTVKYDETDSFIGPRGRLVKVENEHNVYHYENESFIKVEISDGSSVEPLQWTEYMPDGTKYIYGKHPDSFSTNSTLKNAVWYITKVVDVHGNAYTYFYKNETEPVEKVVDGATVTVDETVYVYPDKITYTEGRNIDGFKQVVFNYSDREDVILDYS
ncbi:MAG: hypothetical protein JW982_09260, partial [Spirochaetes bacterium]|nr:hypothetical protein [Spirochaetota bacterium]